MNKFKELCKGKYFKLGLIASGAVTIICLYGIVSSAILNDSIWPGLVVLIPMNIGASGMILTRTAMIDAEIKNKELKQDNKFDIAKIPSYMIVQDEEELSMDNVNTYTVSPEAMGVCGLSEQKTETKSYQSIKVKVRKRTRNDFN